MGENGSVEELLVQDHAKVVGNGAQVVVGDGLPDDAAAHGEHLDVDFCALFDGVGQTKGDVKVRVGSEQAVLCPDGSLNLLFYTLRVLFPVYNRSHPVHPASGNFQTKHGLLMLLPDHLPLHLCNILYSLFLPV